MVSIYFSQNLIDVSLFPLVLWSGLALSLVILGYAWWKNRYTKTTWFLGILFILTTLPVAYFGAPAYIYTSTVVVGYHFLTWLIFFLHEKFKRSRQEIVNFVAINLVLFLVLIILSVYHFGGSESRISAFIFDYRVFVILTYIHISTSFMNDEWFKRIENKLYDKFKQS